ncbi:MAG: hypothetical protein ACOYMR_02900 [Ilumatobacteraceae bacterium]
MNTPGRRRGAITAVTALLIAGVSVGVTSGVASAAPGTATTTNACLSNATATYSDLDWTMTGTATPSPATLGSGDITLANASVQVNVPATLLIAGYGLGLLTPAAGSGETVQTGFRVDIPVSVVVTRAATNVDTGGGVKGTLVKKDQFTVTVQTLITDPNGTPGTGDETATPLTIDQPLDDWVVTPLGGDVKFSEAAPGGLGTVPGQNTPANGAVYASASVAGGLVKANFDCFPGNFVPSAPGATSGTTFTPATSVTAFENVTVVAPPTAPVCSAEAVSVGVGQNATVDLRDNCTDVNEGQGGGSPFTYEVSTPSAGSLTATATNGVYTYAAPATDPGAPVVIPFTATDSTGLTSASANISVTVLANQCDATTASCNLTEIVVQPVVGTTMTMDKVPGVIVMSPVVLNGEEQVSTGALQTITVTNARGTAAGWSVTAYATDLGAAGAQTFSPVPGVTVAYCSNAGVGPFIANPALAATVTSDRLCIPADNLGWSPTAAIAHNDIPGDVAQIVAGAPSAASATDWLAALVAAGNTNDPAVGVDGLGGLGGGPGAKTLCSAPTNHSGGTFTCNASLYLGVPASAGAGTYTGGIVLTLA